MLTHLLIILSLLALSKGFLSGLPRTFTSSKLSARRLTNLKGMSLDDIRAKIKSQPGYNPMQDPEAMKTLEENIPPELREVNGALQRLQVAFKVENKQTAKHKIDTANRLVDA